MLTTIIFFLSLLMLVATIVVQVLLDDFTRVKLKTQWYIFILMMLSTIILWSYLFYLLH